MSLLGQEIGQDLLASSSPPGGTVSAAAGRSRPRSLARSGRATLPPVLAILGPMTALPEEKSGITLVGMTKVFAVAVSNGVEERHLGVDFDVDQAPLLHRLVRDRFYEAFLAIFAAASGASVGTVSWLLENVDSSYDDPYEALLPSAARAAVHEFADAIGASARLETLLQESGQEVLSEIIATRRRAEEGDASSRRKMVLAWETVPAHWKDPQPNAEFIQRLTGREEST